MIGQLKSPPGIPVLDVLLIGDGLFGLLSLAHYAYIQWVRKRRAAGKSSGQWLVRWLKGARNIAFWGDHGLSEDRLLARQGLLCLLVAAWCAVGLIGLAVVKVVIQ